MYEKRVFININGYRLSYGRGYVCPLQYHIVWCTGYRRKVLTAGADKDCKELLPGFAEEEADSNKDSENADVEAEAVSEEADETNADADVTDVTGNFENTTGAFL